MLGDHIVIQNTELKSGNSATLSSLRFRIRPMSLRPVTIVCVTERDRVVVRVKDIA